MHVRRVVTGVNADGKSTFAHDGPPPRAHDFVNIPQHASSIIWATDGVEALPIAGDDPTPLLTSVIPRAGETRMLVVDLPPDSVFDSSGFDHQAALAEQSEQSPGLFDHFEEPGSQFHATPTVDYIVVLEGELALVLDEGETIVRAGDVVVQNATRHAWSNRTDKPARIAGVLVGITR